MISTSILRAPTLLRQPAQAALRPMARTSARNGQAMSKRYETQDNRGGKSKLVFRFGLRDVPVELYPMAFVVGAGCVGAAFAIGRHFYLDGLRLGPSGKAPEST